MTLQFGVLGPLEVRRDGVRLDLGAPKQRSVLACLLLARGRVVSSDQLVDVVWGDDPPPSAMPSLQVYVSNLRRLVREQTGGVSPLTRQAPGYVLQPGPGDVDVEVFLAAVEDARAGVADRDWSRAAGAAERAIGCWRGPVLADLTGSDWFEAQAQALQDQLVEVRRLHGTALLGAGQHDEAVSVAQALAREEQFRDDVHRLLVLALHRAGRTPDALEALASYAARLDDELGIEISAEMRDLQVALLRQDPWTAHWPGSPPDAAKTSGPTSGPTPGATRGPATTPAPSAGPSTPVATRSGTFVGRAPQLAVARDVVDDAGAGSTGWLVLTGPAGIGKTRLAEEVVALVEQQGGRAVRARCAEEEGAPAWWPLRQVVLGLRADPGKVLQAPGDAEADTARFAVYERVRALLEEAAADRPLVVLVDDLQWADVTSLRALTYLANAMTTDPVLFLATVRDTETGPEARRAIAELLRVDHSRQLAVPPLADADVAALASAVAGEELAAAEAKVLADRTGGNALFVCEYARLSREERLEGDVPLAVRGVLGRRLESLDAGVLQVLRTAAVIGDVLDLDLMARVTRMDVDDLIDLLDDAADEHIIVPRRDGGGYAFSHALLRDEVLAGMSPIRRQRLHLRVAEALSAQGERLTRRAQHLVAARPLGDPRDLVEACRAAALQAEERWSSETAVGWWESASTALDLLPAEEQDPQERDDLLVAQVQALARSGRGQTVIDVVEREILEATRLGRTSTVGRLAASLVRAAGSWPWRAVGEHVESLLDRLAALESFVSDDVDAHARLLAARAVGACYDPDPRVPDELSRRSIELAETTDDPEVLADALLGRVLTYTGVSSHAEECEELIARLVALPRAGNVDEVIAHSVMTMCRALIGDVAGAEEHLRLGIAGCDLLRLPVLRVQLRWMEVGVVAWRQGPDAAMDTHAAAVKAHRATELYESGFDEMALMMLRWEQGRLAEMPPFVGFEEASWRAAMAAARGDVETAERAVRERIEDLGPMVWASMGHLALVGHVVADLALEAHVERMLEILTPHSGRLAIIGQGPILGPVDLVLARLHLLAGDPVTARALGDAGRELCLRNGSTWWAERCRELSGPPN